jgi:hypothetical protein
MKKKILLKTLVPLASVGITLGAALPITLCSCGNTLINGYNMDGTNWKGYELGALNCTPNADGKTVTINSGSGYVAKDLVIPDTVTDGTNVYEVTSIGSSLFSDSNKNSRLIGSLTIPHTVTTIEAAAFYNCSDLTGSLSLPSSVRTIGANAFSGCSSLTGSLTIPNNVTSIGYGAFKNCTGLTGSLTISNGVKTIGDEAFSNCANFTSLTLPSTISSIGKYAFRMCTKLTYSNVTLPSGTFGSYTTISNGKFKGVVTGASVKTIVGCLAFGTLDTDVFTTMGITDTIPDNALAFCSGLKVLTIPDDVVIIGFRAFYGCTSIIGNLTIPNSVTTIGAAAFEGCSGLTGNLTIPNGVTKIDYATFANCTGLTGTLTIGTNVTTITSSRDTPSAGAFSGDKFTDVINNSSSFILANNVGAAKILLSSSTNGIYDYSETAYSQTVGDIVFNHITIPDSVATIRDSAFANCTGLTGLTVGNSVTNIGYGAFYRCSGLTGSLTIPDNVTIIERDAFYECIDLTGSLTLGNNVITIGLGAFLGCSGFTSLVCNFNSKPTIGDNAFGNWNTTRPHKVYNNSTAEPPYTSQQLCEYLYSRGLTNNWTAG